MVVRPSTCLERLHGEVLKYEIPYKERGHVGEMENPTPYYPIHRQPADTRWSKVLGNKIDISRVERELCPVKPTTRDSKS